MERHYQSSTADSAMTEIALALAMGFFSIMVLTMVSMGATGAPQKETIQSVVTAALQAPSNESQPQSLTNTDRQDQFMVFYKGGFYDQDLKSVVPGDVDNSRRVILAFAPDLKMNAAIKARAQINTENLIISTLNEEWMTTLRRTVK